MSVHNGERWLKESVDSVLLTNDINFEFIIINDGSTDNTSLILKSYNDDRMIIINQENIGLTKSLNIGLGIAKGKYIARIDADDICLPIRFEVQKKFMEENPDIALSGSDAIIIDERGYKVGHAKYPTSHTILANRLYNFKSVFPHSSIFYRKDIIMKEGSYNENFFRSQDYDLYLRLSRKYKIASIDKPLLKLRLNFSGPTYSDDNQLLFGLMALISHYRRERGLEDYSNNNNNNWESFKSRVYEWSSNNNIDKLHKFRRDLRICRSLLKRNIFLKPIKFAINNLIKNPNYFFKRNLINKIPLDFECFLK